MSDRLYLEFMSLDKSNEILGERIYFFDMDNEDIDRVISQLEAVKEKRKEIN